MECPKCKGNRVLLATRNVFEFFADSESFESSVEERVDPIDIEVCVGIHYCLDCGDILDVWIESPRLDPWMPATSLPEKGHDSLLIRIDFHEIGTRPAIRRGWYEPSDGYWRTSFARVRAHWEVTHWRPMPDMPQVTQ